MEPVDVMLKDPDKVVWVPPIEVVEQTAKNRVCFDFRELHKHVENSHYPSRIREFLEMLHGVTFFSTLDLARGYHQPCDDFKYAIARFLNSEAEV